MGPLFREQTKIIEPDVRPNLYFLYEIQGTDSTKKQGSYVPYIKTRWANKQTDSIFNGKYSSNRPINFTMPLFLVAIQLPESKKYANSYI